MTSRDRLTVEAVLAAFDEYLRRTRGVCPEVRHNYARFVRAFLEAVFSGGEDVDLARVAVRDVVDFIVVSTRRYRPATVQLAATSLRSFFRFARASGLRADRLDDAVPTVPRRRASLPRHLDAMRFAALLASLDASSSQGLRDRAIILCVARLGLRASEVARLRLEDIDWRNGTVQVVTRKTGHGALLPLPADLGDALAGYLQHGRPDTQARQVFVVHRQRVGAPITRQLVGDAVDRAIRRAGIDAPMRGANLLRHSLATDLLTHAASMKEIADVFGHASLATTSIYASVDVAALRQAALPWPQVTS